jgi:hypothetical protein
LIVEPVVKRIGPVISMILPKEPICMDDTFIIGVLISCAVRDEIEAVVALIVDVSI